MLPSSNKYSLGKVVAASSLLLWTGLSSAAEEQAAQLSTMPMSDPGYLLQVFISLAAVVAVIFMLSLLLRKFDFTAPRAEGPIRVLHSVSLGGKEQLLLVEVGKEQILLGRAPGQITRVHKLEQPVADLDKLSQVPAPVNLLGKVFNRTLS